MRSLALVLLIAACGTTGGGSVLPTSRDRTVVPPERQTPKYDYASQGRAEALGKSIEIIGADTVWLRDQPLLVTLDKTSWETMGDKREGKARFKILHEGQEQVITIEEGRSKTVFGYTIKVTLAFETYSKEQLQTVPHAKFTVTK